MEPFLSKQLLDYLISKLNLSLQLFRQNSFDVGEPSRNENNVDVACNNHNLQSLLNPDDSEIGIEGTQLHGTQQDDTEQDDSQPDVTQQDASMDVL